MKKVNGKVSVLAALVMLFGVVFAACGDTHQHTYGAWQLTTPPTCVRAGEETRVCSGDETHTQTRSVPALGHKWGTPEILVPATETAEGLQKLTCTRDGCSETMEEKIPPLGGGPVVTDPVIPPDAVGVFVLAGYERYISRVKTIAVIEDFTAYCSENAVPYDFIGYRMYYGDTLAVAALGAAIIADGDVDALLGGGNNIRTEGGLAVLIDDDVGRISAAATDQIYNNGALSTNRRHATFNREDLTEAFWTYIFLERAVTILTRTTDTITVPVASFVVSSADFPGTFPDVGNAAAVDVDTGAVFNITVAILPENATFKGVSYASSDHAIATVTDGEVKVLAPGEFTISVKSADPAWNAGSPYVYKFNGVGDALPSIPPDAVGVFVLGGYARYISEEKIQAIVNDFRAYCDAELVAYDYIGYRMYEGTSLNVGALCELIRADGDVDALLGAGNNIDSAGNLDNGYVTHKSDTNQTIYHAGSANDGTRRHVTLNAEALTEAFWTYINLQRAADILTAVPG